MIGFKIKKPVQSEFAFSASGMVDTFQKKYEAMQIPYPKDSATAHIDKHAVEQKAAYEKFVADSKLR